MKLVLVTTLALSVGASTLAANPMDHALADARLLMESCESPSPTLRAMCLGYLAAVSDEVKVDREQPDSRLICRPSLVDLDLYRQAYVAFVKAEALPYGHPSFGIVRASFARRWPC